MWTTLALTPPNVSPVTAVQSPETHARNRCRHRCQRSKEERFHLRLYITPNRAVNDSGPSVDTIDPGVITADDQVKKPLTTPTHDAATRPTHDLP